MQDDLRSSTFAAGIKWNKVRRFDLMLMIDFANIDGALTLAII